MTEQQIIEHFLKVVDKGLRHAHYQHTVDSAQTYRAFVSGEGMDSMMKKFARRENDAQFKQRKEITNHIIKPSVKNIADVFRKVPRSNYVRELRYDVSGNDSALLEQLLSRFWAGKSADQYCATRLLELNCTDPNAWLVLEWGDFDYKVETASPYAYEVSSKDAVFFGLDVRGEVEYLIAATSFGYVLYLKSRTISLRLKERGDLLLAGKNYEYIEHIPHNLGFVPAMRVGYLRDASTDGATFAPIYDAAIPYFRKTIKAVSELDLSVALHAFPITLRYEHPCTAVGCSGGKLGDGTTCSECDGRGTKKPTSTQEEVVVSLPHDHRDIINLESLMTYKAPPTNILEWLDNYVDSLDRKAKQVVFNSDILSRSQLAETATAQVIDLQNVYDTLAPYAQQFANVWEFIAQGVAKIISRSNGLTARIIVPRDFKLKSVEQLMADLKAANENGASPLVRSQIQADIARVMFADDPAQYQRWIVRERYNPFSGISDTEVLLLLSSPYVPERKKILYANLGYIFDEIEQADPTFYLLEQSRQDQIVNGRLDAIVADTSTAKPPMIA